MTLLPTLDRPKILANFLDSAIQAETSTPGMVIVDKDDYEKHKRSYDDLVMPKDWALRVTTAVSMGDKVREVWPEVKSHKWVNLLNDDHYIMTKEWDKKLVSLLNGTNMVSCHDGWNFGTNVVGATMLSMPLIEAMGFPIFPRNLQHYFIDNILKSIGEQTGCWIETMKVVIEHKHVFRGQMEADDTFKLVNDPQRTAYDQKEAQHFMDQDFAGVVERIKKLREGHVLENKFV